jgi:ATP phosphoribosyltransferase regulatory subunit
LVNQAEYYTGIIFRGYLDGIGEPVLSGGRYDNLIQDFGGSLSATGFAVTVDLVTGAVGYPAQKAPDILVFADENHLPQAINYIKSLAQNGLTVENCVLDDFEAAADYARRCGIAQLHVVDDEIEIIDVDTL